MNNHEQSIEQLVEQLILLGDDREELLFWIDLYPHLSNDEQISLRENLEKELKELQKNN